jgi:GTP:adenosylcobinamide-phosphate guanylyltransferase
LIPVTALVLAGTREAADPMAVAAGVSHKALLPINGTPMIARVLRALGASQRVGRIVVCIEGPEVLAGLETAGLPSFETLPARSGPSASVAAGLAALGTPLLVTTADHALLRPEWVDYFLAQITPGWDVAAAVAPAARILAETPDTHRTFIRFADGPVSGCNLFYFATPRSVAAVALWQRIEAYRKQPLRLLRELGPLTALRYGLGWLSRAQLIRQFSQRTGIVPALVDMPFGQSAIDVDKPADLETVRRILAQAEP